MVDHPSILMSPSLWMVMLWSSCVSGPSTEAFFCLNFLPGLLSSTWDRRAGGQGSCQHKEVSVNISGLPITLMLSLPTEK